MNGKVAATSFMYCGESPAEAREHGVPPALYFNRELERYFSVWNEGDYQGQSYAAHKEVYKVRPGGIDWERLVDNGTWLIGDAPALTQTLTRWQTAGVDQMILMVQLGHARHERIMASLRRFATDVMPRFQGIEAGATRSA